MVLSAEKVASKHGTTARVRKRDQKKFEMTKKTMTDLLRHIQTIVIVLKKNLGNRKRTFSEIRKDEGQAF